MSDEQRAMLDWAESMGLETLKNHIESMEGLKKDSVNTLAILLAAIGASLAYVMQCIEANKITPITCATIALIFYLYWLGSRVIRKCLKVANAPTIGNHPLHLYQPERALSLLKSEELRNIEGRIQDAKRRNEKTSEHLNRVRALALASPIVVAVVWAIAAIYVRSL